ELAAGELDRRLRAAEEPVARELDLPHEPARLGHVGERRLRVMLVEADDDAAAVPERRLAVRQPEEIDPRAELGGAVVERLRLVPRDAVDLRRHEQLVDRPRLRIHGRAQPLRELPEPSPRVVRVRDQRVAENAAPFSSDSPLEGEKKYSRDGSTASRTVWPTRALVRESTRATSMARSLSAASSPVSSSPLSDSASSITTCCASTAKKTWESEPRSSTTSAVTSICGRLRVANAASSNASGRMPTITRPSSANVGCRSRSTGREKRPKLTVSPVICPSTRFI